MAKILLWGPLLCLITGLAVAETGVPGGEEGVPPPKPYEFNIKGFKDQEVGELRQIPGILEVVTETDRTRVVFQPWNDNPWAMAAQGKPKWIKGAEGIYAFLPIKRPIGRTQWTHGALGPINSDSVIWYGPVISGSKSTPLLFNFMYNDLETSKNEIMRLVVYSECDTDKLVHEMLRGRIGKNIRIEKCGSGYAVVAGEGRGAHVAWQVNARSYVQVDFCFDREMVAAYMDRFGCVTPSDFKVSLNTWIEDEIRWRVHELDAKLEAKIRLMHSGRGTAIDHLTLYFPDVAGKLGILPLRGVSHVQYWEYTKSAREFLWANRANFKYDAASGRFPLKEKDLYDPEHPPELPEDMRCPPKPDPVAAPQSTGND
ncbi:MAG: hypothetical protein HS116_22780 [Planctomycetes bacterium]|nr:hypothetical protein [Planctomycetota bacterium]